MSIKGERIEESILESNSWSESSFPFNLAPNPIIGMNKEKLIIYPINRMLNFVTNFFIDIKKQKYYLFLILIL